MRFAYFSHSLVSDWNHGNAHFLRGLAQALIARGHPFRVFEPRDGWSRKNLVDDHGSEPLERMKRVFPELESVDYDLDRLDLDAALEGVDVAIVHEWSDPELVARLGRLRARSAGLVLLFHDTHHRAVTAPAAISALDLREYDGVLAFGASLGALYVDRGWAARAFTFHEAADVRVFRPIAYAPRGRDLVWIGNFGDEERTHALVEYLIEPARTLELDAHVFGVRYPESVQAQLRAAGIAYHGFLTNFDVPRVFAEFRVTVHVPRRPYVEQLPGIPTIRVFEALASGIPLVSAPWDDVEGLFTEGRDYLVARDGADMTKKLRELLADADARATLAAHGLATVLARHTCDHRAEQLTGIIESLRPQKPTRTEPQPGRNLESCSIE